MKILAVNPGSTSTKLAVYEDESLLFKDAVEHDAEAIRAFETIADQAPMRKAWVVESLKSQGLTMGEIDCYVGRGGPVAPLEAGAYIIDEVLAKRSIENPITHHASNLGAVIGLEIHKEFDIPAYIYDAVSTDQLEDVARITGLKELKKISSSHALNMRATALKAAEDLGKKYEDCRFVVAHLGGGITLSAHKNGRMADIVSDDEGPFSPERAGRIPLRLYTEWAFKESKEKALKVIRSEAGLYDYLGTKDVIEVERRIKEGDKEASLVYDAMVLQVAKAIGEMAVFLNGDLDAILLTGGIAYSEKMQGALMERVGFIGPVKVYPGENELEALAFGGLRVMRGEEEARRLEDI